jgi:hypothetical protein
MHTIHRKDILFEDTLPRSGSLGDCDLKMECFLMCLLLLGRNMIMINSSWTTYERDLLILCSRDHEVVR